MIIFCGFGLYDLLLADASILLFQNPPVNQEGDGVKVPPPRALWKRRTGCNGRGFIWLTIAGMAGRQVGMVGAGRWLLEMAVGAWDLGGGRD
jgi:hypothetical protein